MSNGRRRLVVTTLVALVGAFFGVAGTGHAYLRRWKRSILWLALTLVTMIVLINQYVPDPASLDPFDTTALPMEVLLPVVVVLAFSVADAVLLAYLDGRASATASATSTPSVGGDVSAVLEEDDGVVSCPHCGKETDAELDFCTWCTESLAHEGVDADE